MATTSIRTEATNDPNFRAWFIEGTTTTPMWCAQGQSYPISGDYIGCCGAASCARPTECVSRTLFYPGSSTETCSENRICVTMTVYEAPSPAQGTARRDIFCAGPGWPQRGYLALPLLTAATSTGTAKTSTSGDASTTPTTTGATSSPSASSSPDSGSGSKAWIAGVVVGPLVGVALGVAVFFMLRRRWKRKHEQHPAGGGAPLGQMAELDWNKPQNPPGYPNQQPPAPDPEMNRWPGPPLELDAGQATRG